MKNEVKKLITFAARVLIIFAIGAVALIILPANKINMEDGKESYDLNWSRDINIKDSSYFDPQPTQRGFQAKFKGFKVFNHNDTAMHLRGLAYVNSDTQSYVIPPYSWCPIVFKAILSQPSRTSDSLIKIAK